MPRNTASSVENNFIRGLITEATGLNFPENACTDTDNCHFDLTGAVRRRLGFNFEDSANTQTIDRDGAAISTYVWKNASLTRNITLYVVQVGTVLYFYEMSLDAAVTDGAAAGTIDLTTYKPTGAPSPIDVACQFSDGNGYLFVTHPTLNTFYVTYDSFSQTPAAAVIDLKMRDFVGVDDSLDDDERPTTLSAEHNYNLANQGWAFSSYGVETSSSSITPGTGAKAFTVTNTGPWAADDPVYIYSIDSVSSDGSVKHYMQGTVTSYVGTTLTVNVTSFGPSSGAGAKTDWSITPGPDYLDQFQQTMGLYPSNVDVWWLFKDADDEFNPAKTAPNVNRGTTPAPKGRMILKVCDQQRDSVSGIAGITDVDTSYYRSTTCAFFAGRVFYAGIPYQDYGSNIYFTQILTQGELDFGKCYQESDPTSETLFDLLPNDGGVIAIPEAGQIFKLWAMQGGLIVFSSNGIWQVSGSTGFGFTADDYSVRKISTIRALSATSFVDVGGYPAWWSAEGIYILQPDQLAQSVSIKSLTDETIATYYTDIPVASRQVARGHFDPVAKKVHWLYRSTAAASVTETYEFDKILIFNARTSAFNPWTVATHAFKFHDVFLIPNDDTFKYLGSASNGAGSYTFTVFEENSTQYVDFYSSADGPEDYTSYFVSGYKVHGQAQRKFQANYVYIFSQEIPTVFNFVAIWDYANSADSGSWGSQAYVSLTTDANYDIKRNRLKIRGEGLALQFKVISEGSNPFNIIGWSTSESGNTSV